MKRVDRGHKKQVDCTEEAYRRQNPGNLFYFLPIKHPHGAQVGHDIGTQVEWIFLS